MRDSSAEHTQNKTPKMALLLSLIIQKIEGFSTQIYSVCDTCDSKKQHRCWKVRAYTHTCVRTAHVHSRIRRESKCYVCVI